MSKKTKKPSNRSAARDTLDGLINAESLSMIDRMADHQKITLEDHYAQQVADGTLSAKDLVDIDVAFLIQEIAGIKVLMRGDLARTGIEYEEARTIEEAKVLPPLDAPPRHDA